MEQLRCSHCQALLAVIDLAPGSSVEIKCRNCNTMARLVVQRLTPAATPS